MSLIYWTSTQRRHKTQTRVRYRQQFHLRAYCVLLLEVSKYLN